MYIYKCMRTCDHTKGVELSHDWRKTDCADKAVWVGRVSSLPAHGVGAKKELTFARLGRGGRGTRDGQTMTFCRLITWFQLH